MPSFKVFVVSTWYFGSRWTDKSAVHKVSQSKWSLPDEESLEFFFFNMHQTVNGLWAVCELAV